VPNANIVFGGSGANRTVRVTPATNQTGTTTITVTVSDGTATASDTYVVTVTVGNAAPTITNIADQTVNEDTSTGALAFTIADAETAVGSLTVTRATSNTTLVPLASVVLGGSGANRTVTVTPAANQTGTATITVTVNDGAQTANDTFVVTVNPVNDAPTVADIGDQLIAQSTSTPAIAFTLTDPDTAVATLTVTGSSSNQTLVPNANIVLGGSGASRTVTITPVSGLTGSATITVSASDGALTGTDMFVLTVNADGAPTYLLAENFEAAGFDNAGWSPSGAANPDYTALPLEGLQSFNTVGAQYAERNFANSTAFSMYVQVRFNTYSPHKALISWDNTNWATTAGLWVGFDRFELTHGNIIAVGTTTIAANTTYHVWVEWTKGTGTNGTMKLFVSTTGVKPATPEASITTGRGTGTARMYLGPFDAGLNVIFDRLLLAATPIGSTP
jgi:hypothetical protein